MSEKNIPINRIVSYRIKLETRMNDIRKFNKKFGDYSGQYFANGLEFAIQELDEGLPELTQKTSDSRIKEKTQ